MPATDSEVPMKITIQSIGALRASTSSFLLLFAFALCLSGWASHPNREIGKAISRGAIKKAEAIIAQHRLRACRAVYVANIFESETALEQLPRKGGIRGCYNKRNYELSAL